MKLGYARVSPGQQTLAEQTNLLEDYGCEKIYTDNRLGKRTNRDGLKAMLEYARKDDVVIVCKLDRLATSIQDLHQITNEFKERGIELVSVAENIDTSAEMGDMFFYMIDVLAEFERELASERIRSGIQQAREKGVKLGRKEANVALKEKANEMYESGDYTMREITEATGLSRATIYRYIAQKKALDN